MRDRLCLGIAPVGAMALIMILSALGACGASPRPTGGAVEGTRQEPSSASAFAASGEIPARAPTSTDALLADALAGVPEETPNEELGSRLPIRPLALPKPGRGASARFSFEDGKRGWIAALPTRELLTSPAYGDGRVFLGGGFASHRFFAFDAFRGDLEWSLAAPDGGPTAALYDRDRVIFNTESCTLFVADARTGELVWKRWLGDPLMSQPALGADLVLSAYPTGAGHRFGAYDLATGEPRWDVAIPADVIQAPQVRGDDVFFATMDGTVHRLRVRDGRVLWRKNLGATSALWVDRDHALFTRRVDARGVAYEEAVVVSAASGDVLRTAERIPAPYLQGTSRDRALASGQAGAWGSVPHGARLGLRNVASGWAYQGSSPAVVDGRAYTAVGPELVARDVATGEVVWRRRDGRAGDAQTVSPPAVVGAQLVYGTVDGHLYFSDIDTGLTLRAYDVGEPIVFQPIVAQGWVYVATGGGHLIGLEVGDHAFDGWHMWGGNPQHGGLTPVSGEPSPRLLASRERPGRGTLRLGAFRDELADDADAATDANEGRAPAALLAPHEQPDLPQIGVRVDADVSGSIARVAVTQTFENPHERAIEAVYLFPLPADAAVDDMEMHVGGRIVRAQIRRRAQARREYAEARATGRRAALLEQERDDLFVQRVANIGPGETVRVRLTYVQVLPFLPERDAREGGAYELAVPMSAPRRFEPTNAAAVVPDPAERRRADTFDLSVRLRPGIPLVEVSSPTHALETTTLPDGARVASSGEETERDFILRFRVGGAHPEASLFTHRAPVGPDDDGAPNGYFGLLVQPPTVTSEATVAPRELTFVIDRSSSMTGRPLAQAQALVRRVVAAARAEDTIRIVTFGDELERFDTAPRLATDENKAQAAAFVDQLRAVGATRMVPAIEDALRAPERTPDDTARLRVVVLLTDGWIGNEREVLAAMVHALGDARVYPVGLGAAPNRFLLERAAEVGRGRAIVGALAEEGDALAARLADLTDRPVMTDLEIDWGGLDVREVYPRHLPDLFAGQPVRVQGRFERGGEATVRIRGTQGGRRVERAITVHLPTGPAASARAEDGVHETLWARAAIGERMRQLTFRDDPALVDEITTLGLRHRLVTPYTSFVAVDVTPRAEAAEETADDRASVTPARSLPGDPEIRIPAPRDARAVTVVLPFGETLAASWEPELGRWSARFLIPGDAEEGSYPIEIAITHADGRLERLRLWYTVDASAPVLEVEALGAIRPGERVRLRARQLVTDADLAQLGRARSWLTDARAQLLHDARRVEARVGAEVVDLVVAGPGTWEADVTVPTDVRERFELELVVVDLAANVRTQAVSLEVTR
ncbi:MAG: PQQ-binding-like beta-propeller repeat protein [Myxococcales bacterium]|nr:PQQ-binding-like beta-propeller repeat protein [Myxococcales bacterium]